ncbi:Protein of uncharacterised function DUF262 [Klebsiella pneumoniae]|uniref:DUF262 domain-containing protein n=1 Tax=Klebsiella pneumoniae TaxID=573 RepID=UPI000E2AFC05|nr:DUF262 domain-containing protein [Klebsiella pneumoniae]SXK64136.1 Protein of uncharacterised function DUF262 [Klebsiella pneumoniae]
MSFKQIEARFTKAQDDLVLQQSDLSLKSVSDMIDFNAIDISPKYQRRERWSEEEESELIESFLMNIPIPPIYLAEDEYGIYSVIDGKQRLTAINRFLNNKLTLSNLNLFPELNGLTFSTLPNALSNALAIRPYIRVVTLLRQSNPELKHEVFLRLNKAGVPLNSQEIRNVAFRGELNDALFELSENVHLKEMLKSTKTSPMYREMTDVQYVLRFFTLRAYWEDFPGNMDKAMDSYMSENVDMPSRDIDNLKHIFNRSVDFCEAVWGVNAFKRLGKSSRVIQGMYDVQMVSSSLLNHREYDNAILKPREVNDLLLNEMTTNEEFLISITQFTSNAEHVRYRIEHFTSLLKRI